MLMVDYCQSPYFFEMVIGNVEF